MRTIKFRGKTDKGQLVSGFYYAECGNAYIIENRQQKTLLHRNITHKVDPDTIGQFTGLHDKNGNEIYEGDFVKIKGSWGGVVLWNSRGYFYIKDDNYSDDEEPDLSPLGSLLCYERKQLEIIGNIHDNPELLKK